MRFIVVAAPGHYVDRTPILSTHGAQADALEAADRYGQGCCVRAAEGFAAGADFLSVYEETCPLVYRPRPRFVVERRDNMGLWVAKLGPYWSFAQAKARAGKSGRVTELKA